MKRLIIASLLSAAGAAHATTCANGAKDWPTCTSPTPASSNTSSASAGASASSIARATGVGIGYGGAATALGGGASSTSSGGAVSDSSRSSMYVFPAPVYATPLPANLCPKGDSLAWSIGWNFFSYASSSTRTEMECLEKWVELNRVRVEVPPVAPVSFLTSVPVPPVCPTPAKRKVVGVVKKATC